MLDININNRKALVAKAVELAIAAETDDIHWDKLSVLAREALMSEIASMLTPIELSMVIESVTDKLTETKQFASGVPFRFPESLTIT